MCGMQLCLHTRSYRLWCNLSASSLFLCAGVLVAFWLQLALAALCSASLVAMALGSDTPTVDADAYDSPTPQINVHITIAYGRRGIFMWQRTWSSNKLEISYLVVVGTQFDSIQSLVYACKIQELVNLSVIKIVIFCDLRIACAYKWELLLVWIAKVANSLAVRSSLLRTRTCTRCENL